MNAGPKDPNSPADEAADGPDSVAVVPKAPTKAEARRVRQSKALRDNLKRRKAQMRNRTGGADEGATSK